MHSYALPPMRAYRAGLRNSTRETLILCEAAGYDVILIETVGIGQSEFEVHGIVDMMILILITGAGDDLQAIKRGIMEMADLIVVNKADGQNTNDANRLYRSLKQIMSVMPTPRTGWNSQVVLASSLQDTGIDTVWQTIEDFFEKMQSNQQILLNRRKQAVAWMQTIIKNRLQEAFFEHERIKDALEQSMNDVESESITPRDAAERLIELFFASISNQPHINS